MLRPPSGPSSVGWPTADQPFAARYLHLKLVLVLLLLVLWWFGARAAICEALK